MGERRDEKMRDRQYRSTFMESTVESWLSYQLLRLLDDRRLSVDDLAKMAGVSAGSLRQTALGSGAKVSVRRLLVIANALDIALEVRFVGWPQWLEHYEDTSPEAMSVDSFPATPHI